MNLIYSVKLTSLDPETKDKYSQVWLFTDLESAQKHKLALLDSIPIFSKLHGLEYSVVLCEHFVTPTI